MKIKNINKNAKQILNARRRSIAKRVIKTRCSDRKSLPSRACHSYEMSEKLFNVDMKCGERKHVGR